MSGVGATNGDSGDLGSRRCGPSSALSVHLDPKIPNLLCAFDLTVLPALTDHQSRRLFKKHHLTKLAGVRLSVPSGWREKTGARPAES